MEAEKQMSEINSKDKPKEVKFPSTIGWSGSNFKGNLQVTYDTELKMFWFKSEALYENGSNSTNRFTVPLEDAVKMVNFMKQFVPSDSLQ